MSQAERYRETMIKKYGTVEAWETARKANSAKGGKATSGYEFAHGKLDPSKIGKIGGIENAKRKRTKQS